MRKLLFATTHDWWTWDHPRIRDPLQAVHLVHLSAEVDQALEENRRREQSPSTWGELCAEGRIRRDPHHFRKMKRGCHAFNDFVLLGIATTLGLDMRELLPTTEDWLTDTTAILCSPSVDVSDARSYVEERLAQALVTVPSRASPSRVQELPESVQRVARILDPILISIDGEIELRRKTK